MESVFFEIWQEDYSDKALAREFGAVILQDREFWRRIVEPFPVLMLWYCALKLLTIALTPTKGIAFLSGAVMWIGITLALVTAAVALWVTVYLIGFRAAAVGRKRLQKITGWVRYRFEEACLSSESEKGTVSPSYEELAQIIDSVYEGKQAFYFKLIGTNLYMIIQKQCFNSGIPADFRTFISEKIGKTIAFIK